MKKLILILFATIFSMSMYSEILTCRTNLFAINEYNEYYGEWTGWSDWEESNMLVTINAEDGIVVINSPYRQVYSFISNARDYYDSDNERNIEVKFIDQDGDRGTLRLILRNSGNLEMYINFSNVRWCYQLKSL